MWPGRIGAGPGLVETGPHGGRHRPATRGLRPARRRFDGQTIVGVGFDRDRLARPASSRPARWPPSPTATTPTSSWPASPGRPSASSGWWPASTTRARAADLRAARHPHRRHRGVDHRAGAAPDPARRRRRSSGSIRAPRCRWSSGSVGAGWAGQARSAELETRRRARVVAPQPPRASLDVPARRSWSRRATWSTSPSPATRSTTSTTTARRAGQGRALMQVVIAGGGNVGTLHRRGAAGRRPRRHDHRQRPRPWCSATRRRRAARRARGSPADACEVAQLAAAELSTTPTSSPPSPATTRTTSSSRCWPSRSSACPASSPGSTTRRTSGCSTRRGASTSPCRRRTCSPRWSRRRSRSARSCACCRSRAGEARLAEVDAGRRLAGRRQGDRRSSASPATPPWWPSSGPTASIVPRGDTVLRAGDEVLVLVTADSEDEVRQHPDRRCRAQPLAQPRLAPCQQGVGRVQHDAGGRARRGPRPRARCRARARCRRCGAAR